jgi:Matrixin
MKRQKLTRRLFAERLEERDVPATFGVAWPDPQHLTVSFVPDGTSANGGPSALFQSFNATVPTSVWQAEILRAIQTWTAQANINVSVVADGGQALGASGLQQRDTRFGDIRIAARDLGPDALAVTAPFDPLGGTRSGDMLLNTTAGVGVGAGATYDLYTVALQESGHALGLGNSTDPLSVMYETYSGVRTGLSDSDIANIQSLYGARPQDQYEGPTGNNTLATASTISSPNVAADMTRSGSVDYYKYTLPFYAGSNVTVRVQTAGISLLTPKLTVYNSAGVEVSSAVSSDPAAGGVSVQLSNTGPGTTYYFKVEGGRGDVFGIGGYRLKIDSGIVSQILMAALDVGYNLGSLSIPQYDRHSDDTLASATSLNQALYQVSPQFAYAITAGIEDATDQDTYKVTGPTFADGQARTMVLSVAAVRGSTLRPAITVFDASGNQVAADVLVNNGGSYLVQVANVTSGSRYFVKVGADITAGTNATGDYQLGVNYRTTPIAIGQLASSNLADSQSAQQRTLTISESQVTHFVLSAGAVTSSATSAVRMTVFDENGTPVFVLTAWAGQSVSGDVYLEAGTYRTVFVAATVDGSTLQTMTYNLRGKSITDPMGPGLLDPNDPYDPGTGTTEPVLGDPTSPDPTSPLDPITNPFRPLASFMTEW